MGVATAAAAIVDQPGGSQWAILEPGHEVLVVDVVRDRETEWYRVEFEFCCVEGAQSEWVFGWLAADLETAGLDARGFDIEKPDEVTGPTLEATDWVCPATPEELYRIPEPVRHECYDLAETISIRGVLTAGVPGDAHVPWSSRIPHRPS